MKGCLFFFLYSSRKEKKKTVLQFKRTELEFLNPQLEESQV